MCWIAGSEVEGEVRVQNADGTVEVQADEEPWDGSSSATSSSDVSAPLLPASISLSQVIDRAVHHTSLKCASSGSIEGLKKSPNIMHSFR